ncbi:MAG: hypothetical protein QME64_11320 [bacterium]|nr:hypothetical protein [bacterium]
MSIVMVVAPIVSASWPIISTAALSAATSFGFTMLKKEQEDRPKPQSGIESVELEIENSEVFKGTLQDEKELVFKKDAVKITFYADEHGKCMLRVKGAKKTKPQLQQIGKEMMNRFTQQYVYT